MVAAINANLQAVLNPASIPLSLYVHFPWCVRKCPYCDFNSHTRDGGALPQDDYADRLIDDLTAELARVPDRPIVSVFFGGGTPSLMSGLAFGRFMDRLHASGRLASDAEITLEANPGTVERQYFADYVAAGVNRFSLGVQSFDEQALSRLGRIHGRDDVYRAWELIQALNVPRTNIDLMHGLPEQTPESGLSDLQQALTLDPGHLSWYQLTIEPNTQFYQRPPQLPDEATLEAIEEQGRDWLEQHGYAQYEVSAWARPDQDCRHNQVYWQFGDYLGIGAGAHGKITTEAQVYRTTRTRMPDHYLKAIDGGRKASSIAAKELPFEYMLNALRLRTGVAESQWIERTGLPLGTIAEPVSRLREKGMMIADRHQLTERGWWFYNDAVEAFLMSE